MNLIFSPVYQATTGAVDDAETDVEAAKDAADFGSVKSMPLDNNYHIRVLIPCYKEPYEIVLRTVNAIRDAVLPAGALRSIFSLSGWTHVRGNCRLEAGDAWCRLLHHADVHLHDLRRWPSRLTAYMTLRGLCLRSRQSVRMADVHMLHCFGDCTMVMQAAGAPSTSATMARTARSGAFVSAWAATASMFPVST